jgi:hypothetical protein
MAVHTKSIVGGKSDIFILFNLLKTASISLEKGIQINGIQEKVIVEILYSHTFCNKLTNEFFAATNLEGLISSAVIDKDTSNNI